MTRPLRDIESSWNSGLKLYSNPTIECLERLDSGDESFSRITGHSSRSGHGWAWLARGSAIEVVDVTSGQRLSAWRFGWSSSKQLSFSVTCVAEMPSPDGLYLVVGLRSTGASSAGMVCLFDPVLSRVVKAISTPRAVTAMECVTGVGHDAQQHAISEQLQLMCGLVAVGMECGHVYVVDMRLDDDLEEFDEWNPSHLQIVDPHNANIPKQRESAKSDGAHVAFELGAECHMLGSFSYASPDGDILGNFSSSDISITSLKYIRQLGSLVVGYSFGCFQVWDLEQHARDFSSSVDVYSLAVTHVVYQEPENDPRLCCYLWIGRGQTSSEEIIDSSTTITLYQLSYEQEDAIPGYGRVLKEFSGCCGRFEHQLTGDPYHLADATSCGSKILCFYTIERAEAVVDVTRSDDNSDDFVPKDLTLAACVWEAPAPELSSSPTCHLAVFDINRWYHSQMPASIRDAMYGSKYPTCPFFSVYSLAEVLDAGNPDALVDVLLQPNEIGRFSSAYGTQPEQFFWASSLSFDIVCLMETGIVNANFHGSQQQVLDDLHLKGVTALGEAHDYFHRCWSASLMPKDFDFSRAQEKSFQVESLLSIALEHNQPSFIISCINKLGEDNVTYAGCNLRIILEWAWDQVIQIKQHLDELCLPLFDGTGIFVDKELVEVLDHYGVQLGNLVDIFQALSSSAPTTEQGLKELESQYTVTYLLHQYLQVVLFFMKERLLPELFDTNEDEELSSQYFPGKSIAQEYDMRRRELEGINTDAMGSLMIDRVVSLVSGDLEHGLWETENDWSERYPPPNLHALSSLVLLEKINPTSKLCIIYYSLLDLCSFNHQFRAKKIAEKFAATFGLQPVLTNLFRGFWFLDHQDFENALKLLSISANQLEVAPWQNSHIIRSFLCQEEAKKALSFIRSVKPAMNCPEDVQLHLSVLINNGLVTEAFKFQRECRDPVRRQQLLHHFFNGCHQTKNTNKILELPLNKVEEDHLVKFLESSPFPHARELLVMFYLQRGSYVLAIRWNEQLKHDVMIDAAAQKRAAVRNVIVKKYYDLLPKVQQELALHPHKSGRGKATKYREVPRPRPLSTVVNHKLHTRVMSQAAVVNAALAKISENRSEEVQSAKEAPFTGTPSGKKTKSLLSDTHSLSFPASAKKDQPTVEAKSRVFPMSPLHNVTFSPVASYLRRDRARKIFKGANALSLLQTPPVTKHLSFAATPNHQASQRSNATPPHSILKPTKVSRRSPSPTLPPPVRRLSGERVPWLGPGSDNEESDLTTQKKQIRFKSPSPSSSAGAGEEFSFIADARRIPERIPEEDDDDLMETEPGSVGERSTESGLESDDELSDMLPATSRAHVFFQQTATTADHHKELASSKDDNVEVVAVVDLDNVLETDEETHEADLVTSSEHEEEAMMDHHGDDDGVAVVAVIDLDEDDEEREENFVEHEPETTEDRVLTERDESGASDSVASRPHAASPAAFIDTGVANEGETSTMTHAETTSSTLPPRPTTSPHPTTSLPPDTERPAYLTTTNIPPQSPERRYMPLRDETTLRSHAAPTTGQQTPEHLWGLDPDRTTVPNRHSDPDRVANLDIDFDRHLDPGASTSKDMPEVIVPVVLDASLGSSTPSHPTSHQDSSVIGGAERSPDQARRSPQVQPAACSESSQGSHDSLLGPEILAPLVAASSPGGVRRAEVVSTMTPPMSPPSRVSPRIFLDDIQSPQLDRSKSKVRTPSQSERRQSRSPSRHTNPSRTSPPLTRRQSSRLNTPHQSPTDSPISFVTPVRRTATSPRRKSGIHKKLVAAPATHGMTLRVRSCSNKTTRCAKLPHTH